MRKEKENSGEKNQANEIKLWIDLLHLDENKKQVQEKYSFKEQH